MQFTINKNASNYFSLLKLSMSSALRTSEELQGPAVNNLMKSNIAFI